MNNLIIKRLKSQQKVIEKLQLRQNNINNYSVDPTVYQSGLTLTRINSFAFPSSSTQVIVWQQEIRNTTNTINQIPFTWLDSVITVPQDGYYQIHFYGNFGGGAAGIGFNLSIIGYNPVQSFRMYPQNPKQALFRQYLYAGDTIECILITPPIGQTLLVSPEFNVLQSPILYISRISP